MTNNEKEEEKRTAMLNKEKYLAEGKKIPICVNQGCDNNVVVRDWKYFSFKHHCSDCANRLKKGLPPMKSKYTQDME